MKNKTKLVCMYKTIIQLEDTNDDELLLSAKCG